jgi:hypothetical protein
MYYKNVSNTQKKDTRLLDGSIVSKTVYLTII